MSGLKAKVCSREAAKPRSGATRIAPETTSGGDDLDHPVAGSLRGFAASREPIAPLTDEALIAANAEGLNFSQIAVRWGVSRGSVAGRVFRLRERGVPVEVINGQVARILTRNRFAEWMEEHGGSVAEAAAEIGISRSYGNLLWRDICTRLGWQAS